MLNTILISILLSLGVEGTQATFNVNASESSVEWKATKIVGGGHEGIVNVSEGTIEVDKGQLTGGTFTIDMTSITCTDLEGEWKGKLEGHLKHDDFFGVETYKTAILKITDVKAGTGAQSTVTADITIKGITQSISFPADVKISDGKATATASISLDRTKFGVKYGSSSFFDDLGDKAISNEFTLNISIVATK